MLLSVKTCILVSD